MLAEVRSGLMKQECKVDFLNTCISELQRQTYSQRLELKDTHFGKELQEELVMKEKAFGDIQIGSIHEMEELKRAQEL